VTLEFPCSNSLRWHPCSLQSDSQVVGLMKLFLIRTHADIADNVRCSRFKERICKNSDSHNCRLRTIFNIETYLAAVHQSIEIRCNDITQGRFEKYIHVPFAVIDSSRRRHWQLKIQNFSSAH
jgi:hypothetical protein